MTQYDEIRKKKYTEKRGTLNPLGRISSDAEIIHTELAGGTGPLYVYYRVPEDD